MKQIMYNGESIDVRGGKWCDVMNSWLYIIVDHIKGYTICKEREVDGGKLFALEWFE